MDVFSTNAATTSASCELDESDYMGTGEYCGGCAKVSIYFGENVFPNTTIQTLHMYDAALEIQTEQIQAEAVVWGEKDVFVWKIKDRTSGRLRIGRWMHFRSLKLQRKQF